jgi:serine/threonine-protein kinase HipA
MDREVLVYVDLAGVPHLVGRLWARVRKNKEGATFEYDRSWLEHDARFSLEPALKLGPTVSYNRHGDVRCDRRLRA